MRVPPRHVVTHATPAPAPAAVPPSSTAAVPVSTAGAAFDGTSRIPPSVPVARAEDPSRGPLGVRLAQSGGGPERVTATLTQARARLGVALAVLPDAAEASLGRALDVSAARIGTALQAGAISVDEGMLAAQQVSDMLDVLLAVQQGKARVQLTTASAGDGLGTWELHTTGGDAVRLSVRESGAPGAQARIKLQNIADDGNALPPAQRLMIRFDLEGSETPGAATHAAWDVEFGAEKPPPGAELLDKRIHGVLLGADGQPVINRGGRTVADHHFAEDVPDALQDPAGFRAFTRQLLDALTGPVPSAGGTP